MVLVRFSVMFTLLTIPVFTAAESLSNPAVEQAVIGKNEVKVKPGDCLTEAEYELGSLLNKLRKEHHLPPVPIKEPLYRVAKWHVIDLAINTPHQKTDDRGMTCNLHSWSDKGKELGAAWEPLCYTPDHRQASGMWKKPREISKHRSNGYENIYWTSAPLAPDMAINYWKEKIDELDMILERANWNKHNWRSMGVGIFGSYAAVWFSEKSTWDSEMSLCEKTGN